MCQIFAGQDPARYESVTRRLRLNGQSTSIRLERAFWRILDGIAAQEAMTTPAFISKLHAEVLEKQGEAANFTSLLRCVCTIHLGEYDKMRDADARFAAE
jgi:predicted DNA-binding ribbon-helix-helix protein